MAIEDEAEDQEVEAGGIDAVLVKEDVAEDMAKDVAVTMAMADQSPI